MVQARAKKSAAKRSTSRKPVSTQRRAVAKRSSPAAGGDTTTPVITRRKIAKDNYFATASEKPLDFFSTGCRVLDHVFGGGYVLGRFANIVGDKSTGKTLLAIEAAANFIMNFPQGHIHYVEAEAAFDEGYAGALGMPLESVEFKKDIITVEDFFEDLERVCKKSTKQKPVLYVLDSMDALTDRAEQTRNIDEGSYNMTKQKKLSELFRRKVRDIENSHVALIIISQIREKIGVTFGETKTRTGGKAMDFYASQVVWLYEAEKIKKTIDKVERIIGIKVRAQCKKNKIGLPYRQCSFPLLYGYGIDDLTAGVEWLMEVNMGKRLKELGLSEAGYKIRIGNLRNEGGDAVRDMRGKLNTIIDTEWARIETGFLPKASKY